LENVEEGGEEFEGCVVLRGTGAMFVVDSLPKSQLCWNWGFFGGRYVEGCEIDHDKLGWEEGKLI
jgi:hypothetical protein